MTDKRPFPLPTGYFAIPLGLGALSLAWMHMGDTLSFSRNVSDIIGLISVSVWALFVLLYIYKMIYFSQEVRDEYCCPIRFSFLALIAITTMLSGDILYRWFPLIGEGLIWIGTIGQLLFASVRISALWKDGTFEQKSTLPPFYLPSVATNFTSASSLALLGYQDLGYLFLGAGMIAWIIYEPALLQRLRVLQIEPQFRPTMGIILAPAFVGSSAYLSLNGGEIDLFVKLLWGYGFLQMFFLIRLFPWISEKGMNIGFWSFSFGLASLANGAVSFVHHNVLSGLANGAFIFANLMMSGLVLMTLGKIFKGQFWLK